MTRRNSFVFYRSFFEAATPLSDKEKLSLLNTICEYALNGNEGELEPMAKAMFCLIRPNLDANNKKYENGSKGGRPKKKETKTKPNNNLEETKAKPNHKLMYNELCIMSNVDVDVKKEKDKKEITIEDFSDFIEKENLDKSKVATEIEICLDWYKSKGRVLKDKKAAIRNWIRKDLQKFKKPYVKPVDDDPYGLKKLDEEIAAYESQKMGAL